MISYQGRLGEPRGLYAVTAIPLDLQYLTNFSWVRYGWHSTCKHRKMVDKEALCWTAEQYILNPLGWQKMWRLDLQCHASNLSYEKLIHVTAVSRGLAESCFVMLHITHRKQKIDEKGESVICMESGKQLLHYCRARLLYQRGSSEWLKFIFCSGAPNLSLPQRAFEEAWGEDLSWSKEASSYCK